MARDEQQPWLTDGAFTMFRTILSQSEYFIQSVEWNLIMAKMHFHRSCLLQTPLVLCTNNVWLRIQVPRKLQNTFLKWYCRVVSVGLVFVSSMLTSADENCQRLFDNDVMHSLLIKFRNLNDTECLLFTLFLVNQYSMKVHFLQSIGFRHWTKQNICQMNFLCYCNQNYAIKELISKLALVSITFCVSWEIPLIPVTFRWKIDWVIYKDHADGVHKWIYNSDIVKALWQEFQVGQIGSPVWSLSFELYIKYGIYGMSYICAWSELIFFEMLWLMMKHSQIACNMTYLTQILSEILGMHYMIAVVMSEIIASIFLLLP
jgi:hypothetical protein